MSNQRIYSVGRSKFDGTKKPRTSLAGASQGKYGPRANVAEGRSATEACKNAGYAPNDGNATRLKGNERIKARVSELQECAAAHAAVTLQGLIDEAADTQTKAMADGKYSAAVAALTVKAKLAGLWIDKAENKANNVVYHIADHPLTMDEWAEKYCSPDENVSN